MHGFEQQVSQYAAHGFLALFGALVHALEAQRKGQTKSTSDFISLIIMSSFSGVIFFTIAMQTIPDQQYFVAAAAGTGGYVGVEGMAWIISFLKHKFPWLKINRPKS